MIGENFVEVLEDFENIRKLITDYRDYLLVKKEWDFENDIRFKFVNQLNIVLISHSLNLKYINEKISHLDWLKKEASTDNYGATVILESYITYNKLAFIYTFSSIVERFLRLILGHIDKTADLTIDFYNVRKKVFSQLGFDENGNEWKALSILSNIRNTIHNNGIHLTNEKKLKEFIIHYHDLYVGFINGNPHGNGTYEVLFFILSDLVRLSKLINDHPQITKTKSIIDNMTF